MGIRHGGGYYSKEGDSGQQIGTKSTRGEEFGIKYIKGEANSLRGGGGRVEMVTKTKLRKVPDQERARGERKAWGSG